MISRKKGIFAQIINRLPPMTLKTRTLTATAVFLIFAVLFFLPVPVPHKLVLPVASLFVASLGLTPWQICAALFFSALGELFGAIATAIANADHLGREIVNILPDVEDADPNIIYMTPSGLQEDDNKYYEWILINGVFE